MKLMMKRRGQLENEEGEKVGKGKRKRRRKNKDRPLLGFCKFLSRAYYHLCSPCMLQKWCAAAAAAGCDAAAAEATCAAAAAASMAT